MSEWSSIYGTYVKACCTCKWGREDEQKDIVCTNDKSDQCAEFVDRGFQCKWWEACWGTEE